MIKKIIKYNKYKIVVIRERTLSSTFISWHSSTHLSKY